MSRSSMRPEANLATVIFTTGILWFLFSFFLGAFGGLTQMPSRVELPMGYPKSLAADQNGTVYLPIEPYERIQVYDRNGRFRTAILSTPMKDVLRVAIDTRGRLWYATGCAVVRLGPDLREEGRWPAGRADCSRMVVRLGLDGDPAFEEAGRRADWGGGPVTPGQILFNLGRRSETMFSDGLGNTYRLVRKWGVSHVRRDGEDPVEFGAPWWIAVLGFPHPGCTGGLVVLLFGLLTMRLTRQQHGRSESAPPRDFSGQRFHE